MSDNTGEPIESRLQTASDPAKAFRQYDELRRNKLVMRALIVAEIRQGSGSSFRILGQMATPASMAELCMIAAQGLGQVPEAQRGNPEGDTTVAQPPREAPDPELVDAMTRALVDDGKLIEAGFLGFRLAAVPANAPPGQAHDMQMAFFAGAQHLWASIYSFLDPDADETPDDLRRMENVHRELQAFDAQFRLKHGLPARGSKPS